MNKLLIALCLTTSFGVSAGMTDKEMVDISIADHKEALRIGSDFCINNDRVIKALGGDESIRDSALNACIKSQSAIDKTSALKSEIELLFK